MLLRILLLLLAAASLTRGQTCEEFAGFPGECASVIDSPIFVPAGFTQEVLGGLIVGNVTTVRMFPSICRHAVIRLLCGTAFANCSATGPQPVCRSLCEYTNQVCGAQVVDCFSSSPLNPLLELYPEDGYTIPVAENVTLFIPCFVPPEPANGSIPVSSCPPDIPCCVWPYEYERTNGECEFVCPLFSDEHMTVGLVGALLGFICGVVFLVPAIIYYALHPVRRSFPANIPMWASVAALGAALSMWWAWTSPDDFFCDENTYPRDEYGVPDARWTSAACKTQSFLLLYFVGAYACWYLVLCVQMLLVAFHIEVPFSLRVRHLIAHAFCWLYMIPFLIAALATELSVGVAGVCFMVDNTRIALTTGLINLPVLVVTLVGVILSLVVFGRIATLQNRRLLLANWRILVAATIWTIVVLLWSLWLWIELPKSVDTNEAVGEAAVCAALSLDPLNQCPSENDLLSIDAWSMQVLYFNFLAPSLLIIALCWTHKSFYKFWYHLLFKCSPPSQKVSSHTYGSNISMSRSARHGSSVQSSDSAASGVSRGV